VTALVLELLEQVGEAVRWCFLSARAVLSRRAIPLPQGFATVTLTTYRARQWAAMLAVDSLSRGSVRPAHVVLFVDGRVYKREHLPFPLAVLVRRGVELVLLGEDYGSYTKLPLWEWEPRSDALPVVTMDDDVIYPPDWLLRLSEEAVKGGQDLLCYAARHIACNPAGEFAPYVEWGPIGGTDARYDALPLGVYGVLYRRDALEAIRAKGVQFRNLAPNVDDLWFRFCTIERGIKARRIVDEQVEFATVPFTEGKGLWHENVQQGGNDRKLARIAPLFDLAFLRPDRTTSSGGMR
jgi:hypothetical protein